MKQPSNPLRGLALLDQQARLNTPEARKERAEVRESLTEFHAGANEPPAPASLAMTRERGTPRGD